MHIPARIVRIMALDTSGTVGFWLSIKCLWWGVWFALPINVIGSAKVLHVVGTLAPSWVWSLLFIALGVSELTALYVNRMKFRMTNAILYMMTFGLFAVAGWLSAYNTLAVADYTLSCLMCAYCYYLLLARSTGRGTGRSSGPLPAKTVHHPRGNNR